MSSDKVREFRNYLGDGVTILINLVVSIFLLSIPALPITALIYDYSFRLLIVMEIVVFVFTTITTSILLLIKRWLD